MTKPFTPHPEPDRAGSLRLALLAGLALVGFAANSLLCRAALGRSHIDAASFTSIRMASGALVLAVLSRARSGRLRRPWVGSTSAAIALVAYALCFSFAYRELSTGAGALILFGAVQVTMIGVGFHRGERPELAEWLGLILAFGGLIVLTVPGASAPPIAGALLMAMAGASWALYSLIGRRATEPLATTADNFLGALPVALAASVAFRSDRELSHAGIALAIASGSIASGLGYSLWYAALPRMTSTRAAILQLSVPVLAACAGVLVLGERVHTRLVVAACTILGGVALAVAGRARSWR